MEVPGAILWTAGMFGFLVGGFGLGGAIGDFLDGKGHESLGRILGFLTSAACAVVAILGLLLTPAIFPDVSINHYLFE
jgi:hypothetical protein